jgi:hypothetical protein
MLSFGEVDMLHPERSADGSGVSGWDADRVCLHAITETGFNRPDYEELPRVLVYERPFRGTNQGQWVGAWKAAWVREGGTERRVVGVYPSSWRARVLGKGAASAPREQVRAMETLMARKLADRAVGPDEAAAICIGEWAARAGELVGLVRPTRSKLSRSRILSWIET